MLTLMLVALAGAHLGLELGPDLVQKLGQAADAVAGGHSAHAAMATAVHRHGGQWKCCGYRGRSENAWSMTMRVSMVRDDGCVDVGGTRKRAAQSSEEEHKALRQEKAGRVSRQIERGRIDKDAKRTGRDSLMPPGLLSLPWSRLGEKERQPKAPRKTRGKEAKSCAQGNARRSKPKRVADAVKTMTEHLRPLCRWRRWSGHKG